MSHTRIVLTFKCLILTLIVIVIDQVSKIVAQTYITGPIEVCRFLRIELVKNYGISFGLLSSANIRVWLVFFTSIIMIASLYIMFKVANVVEKVAYAFFVGGAVGNIIDRCMRGYVIDFIDFHVYGMHFPTFNVADICLSFACVTIICVGIVQSNINKRQ